MKSVEASEGVLSWNEHVILKTSIEESCPMLIVPTFLVFGKASNDGSEAPAETMVHGR